MQDAVILIAHTTLLWDNYNKYLSIREFCTLDACQRFELRSHYGIMPLLFSSSTALIYITYTGSSSWAHLAMEKCYICDLTNCGCNLFVNRSSHHFQLMYFTNLLVMSTWLTGIKLFGTILQTSIRRIYFLEHHSLNISLK